MATKLDKLKISLRSETISYIVRDDIEQLIHLYESRINKLSKKRSKP